MELNPSSSDSLKIVSFSGKKSSVCSVQFTKSSLGHAVLWSSQSGCERKDTPKNILCTPFWWKSSGIRSSWGWFFSPGQGAGGGDVGDFPRCFMLSELWTVRGVTGHCPPASLTFGFRRGARTGLSAGYTATFPIFLSLWASPIHRDSNSAESFSK